MIYPNDFETKIGFLPLRRLLVEKCETSMGGRLAESMKFSSDRLEVIRRLFSTKEMKWLLTSGINLPQDTFYDILPEIKRSQSVGAFISAEYLYQCGVSFTSMRSISQFFSSDDFEKQLPTLCDLFKDTPIFLQLETEIFRCIEPGGNVKDNATPELYEIRRSMDSLTKSMHKMIRRIMDESIKNGYVEKDVSPAIRDGHPVIPVSAANKKNIPGILHDTSGTGKTYYIEPAEVVEAGNRIRELELKEEEEIKKILISLTTLIIPHIELIEKGCKLLALYDFIRAKARFAIETDGEMPTIEKEPELDWFHAVHPGLYLMLKKQNREIVPLTINLNKKNRILIISGPNAGGKSVTLKTVGTVQYMMQCGLLPTLYSNSHMGVFKDIFIDIGDEQSMENDLSTYSSHLANMKYFLQNARKESLILADEMGSGTEPQIGAALAQSVVRNLGLSGCFGIITTHYQNLKVFAEKEEGFINGAMLYDRQKLRPTFQLMIGQPGNSFALEIARNIGLPQYVIDYAKEIVGSEYVDSERFLLDIQRDRKYWKNKRLEIKEKEGKINKLIEELEKKSEDLKQQRSQILKLAKEEARDILAGANTQIERSIHEIRKSQADKEQAKKIRKELDEYKRILDNSTPDQNLPKALMPLKYKNRNKKKSSASDISQKVNEYVSGDYVKMEKGGSVGQIISINGSKAEVAFGNLRINMDIKNLIPAQKPKEIYKSSGGNSTNIKTGDSESRQRQLNFKQEIDVRGMRADEALQAVTYFIDDAVQFNIPKVRILHGTGHGILRTLIREQLQSNNSVASFKDEDVRFGGAGITVVEIN